MTSIHAPHPVQPPAPGEPDPVRDSILPAAFSLVAMLAVVVGLAAGLGFVARAVLSFFG